MQSPKQRFQSEKADVELLANLVNSPLFERAADAALIQFANTIEPHDSSGFAKIQGAQNYLKTLCSLAKIDVPELPKKSPSAIDWSQPIEPKRKK